MSGLDVDSLGTVSLLGVVPIRLAIGVLVSGFGLAVRLAKSSRFVSTPAFTSMATSINEPGSSVMFRAPMRYLPPGSPFANCRQPSVAIILSPGLKD